MQLQEYDASIDMDLLNLKQLFSPQFINQTLSCVVDEQPVPDLLIPTTKNYYQLLTNWVSKMFAGNEIVEEQVKQVDYKFLDEYIIDEQAFRVETVVESLKLFDQLYELLCLIIVISVRGRRMAWAVTNINYLPSEHKKMLSRFNVLADVNEDDNADCEASWIKVANDTTQPNEQLLIELQKAQSDLTACEREINRLQRENKHLGEKLSDNKENMFENGKAAKLENRIKELLMTIEKDKYQLTMLKKKNAQLQEKLRTGAMGAGLDNEESRVGHKVKALKLEIAMMDSHMLQLIDEYNIIDKIDTSGLQFFQKIKESYSI
ncbi:hypothetical protein CANARDRAFT_23269 [[Candida] arabinofermentans NRRL YB-2248]|uniref:Uncharacterized protein n=1 Tax=[Candida] arabinofermentans NRRL YB-2248 TaxID=983967 RepID=A0A1E4T0C2_9ASCO|nr:hypothetical protein CANARDRAFT_23269 [[Candida] arabinofermentans NRRL YB-2248]